MTNLQEKLKQISDIIDEYEAHIINLRMDMEDLKKVKEEREKSRLPFDHYYNKLSQLR